MQIRVEGPSDKIVVQGVLNELSFRNVPVRSGYTSFAKGKDAIIKYFDMMLEDDRFEKFLFLMDANARKGVCDLARRAQPVPRPVPVYFIFVPGLETWTQQLLDPNDVSEYGRILRKEGKVEAAKWAASRFPQARGRLQDDPVVQKLRDFCECQPLPGDRFPEDFA